MQEITNATKESASPKGELNGKTGKNGKTVTDGTDGTDRTDRTGGTNGLNRLNGHKLKPPNTQSRQNLSVNHQFRTGGQIKPPMYKINHMIKSPQVRIVYQEGDKQGDTQNECQNGSSVMSLSKALELSLKLGVDLIEIAPKANPPVCKLMDYGKFVYKEQKNHKKEKHTKCKEIGCHVNIAENDLNTKIRHAEEFLLEHHQVTFKVQFRGREAAHKEIGIELLENIKTRLENVGTSDLKPQINGKFAMVRISPKRQNKD